MTFLIDSNEISEIRKDDGCFPPVAAWWNNVEEDDIWLSSLVLGEICKGVEIARRNDVQKAEALDQWLTDVLSTFESRILPVNVLVAEECGRMNSTRPVPVVDALMAATAKVNGLTFVTRNVTDVAGLHVDVLNPFEDESTI